MLQVKAPEEIPGIIYDEFREIFPLSEHISLSDCPGRILAEDIVASEYVPGFDRSTVDGYAVRSSDTFGCSESIPAVLNVSGEVIMGEAPAFELKKGCCAYIPTGGELPGGADCAVMIEHTENYGDGTVGIFRSGAPGMNVIYRGDDIYPGKVILKKGHVLDGAAIGALAAIGKSGVPVVRSLRVGIISTGDEVIPVNEVPKGSQIRDVNSHMLAALCACCGAAAVNYGIVKDDKDLLSEALRKAADECDAVILSGGSSAGQKDAAAECIEQFGPLLLHGIAVKPGKPTILGRSGNKPLIGLPGHPAAAWYIANLLVIPLFDRLTGRVRTNVPVKALLTENISANHGRAQFCPCRLERDGGVLYAHPVRSKSGLITQLTGSDGYFMIDRDCEGLAKGTEVEITLYEVR